MNSSYWDTADWAACCVYVADRAGVEVPLEIRESAARSALDVEGVERLVSVERRKR